MELSEEEVARLLKHPVRIIREATAEDLELIRRELTNLAKRSDEKIDLKEIELLQNHLEKMQIQVTQETEKQIHFTYHYSSSIAGYELKDSGWIIVEKHM